MLRCRNRGFECLLRWNPDSNKLLLSGGLWKPFSHRAFPKSFHKMRPVAHLVLHGAGHWQSSIPYLCKILRYLQSLFRYRPSNNIWIRISLRFQPASAWCVPAIQGRVRHGCFVYFPRKSVPRWWLLYNVVLRHGSGLWLRKRYIYERYRTGHPLSIPVPLHEDNRQQGVHSNGKVVVRYGLSLDFLHVGHSFPAAYCMSDTCKLRWFFWTW